MHIDLDLVPLRDPTLSPEEILMSESQERMMAVVEPDHVEDFLTICRKWDVLATVIGEVTAGDRLVIDWHEETVVDVPPRTVAHQGPVYERPYERPEWQDQVQANGVDHLARPASGEELADTLLRLVGSPNLCDKSWITDQYDRYVRGNSVLAQPDDAGMLRIDEDSGLGIALATDCSARFALLDPYAGAQLALAEAYRNVATTGAEPLAITDCLNFGSPEDLAIMWQFSEIARGLADGCRVLGTPVTGGNVSFYNQTGSTPILPTPVVGVLGVIDDVTRRTPAGFQAAGHVIYLLGETRDELAGSAWADVVHDHLGGQPPAVDLAQEKALAEVLVRASRRGLLASAHDLADGGLAQAAVESALRHGLGARIELPSESDPFVWLFSESAGRALVSVKEGADRDLASLCRINGVVLTKLGVVTAEEDATLEVVGQFTLPLARIREAWRATIPAAMHV
jgi:phosphoribosylformylglycinamidine synthase